MSFLQEIKTPPKQYSPAAFWFWYGELEEKRLREQIDMMVEQGVYNGFMHARAYLKTPYLGEDWFKAVSACIDEGQKVGFYPWLYDEYAWPSGTAGSTFPHGVQAPSRTLAKGECNMAKYLEIKKYDNADDAKDDAETKIKYRRFVSAFCKENGQWKHISDIADAEGETLVFFRNVSPKFVDYMNGETIKEFIGYTHEEYKKRYEKYFGNIVPGIFFDEIFMVNRLPWTDCFADEFQKRCGYDILSKLYAIAEDGGEEERRVRNDYYNVTCQLYEEGFFKQISEWCRGNKLEFTGHIEENFVVQPGRQGQFFNNMRHLDIPGADCHDYRYRFPRKITYREPKFAVSTARAYGRKRMMSEAFGGAGWGCSLEEFKRGVNTLGAMGINMITLHGFYSECDSQGTQADWPTSFFFQNPYWRYFKTFADYMSRVCYMNSLGTPVVEVGLYYPIEEMQIETVAGSPTALGFALDSAWNGVMDTLLEQQIDVDIIDKPCILDGEISDGCISMGAQSFKVLLFPTIAQKDEKLESKLCEFEKSGGHVVYYNCGKEKREGSVNVSDLPAVLEGFFQADVKVIGGTKDNLYVNHRKIDDKEVYFVANTKQERRSLVLLLRKQGGVQKLSPENGELYDVTSRAAANGTEVELSLEADEACWLVVDKKASGAVRKNGLLVQEIAVPGVWEFLPIKSDVTGKEQLAQKSTVLEIPLAAFSSEIHPDAKQIRIKNTATEKGRCGRHLSLWEASWITRRPDWIDNAQKTQLYFRKKFELDGVPSSAKLCIAAVNKWTLWVNGKEVASSSEARKPSVVDICKYLTKGENLIAVKVENDTPMDHFNILSVENIPKEEMISLLAQAEIVVDGKTITLCTDCEWDVYDKEEDGWNTPEFEVDVYTARSVDYLMVCGESDKWLKSWERGRPPMMPWKDLPLFGETVKYPQNICYSLTLPAGTKKVFYPEVSGSNVCITIDGMKRTWENGECVLFPDGNTHQLQISLDSDSADDGLAENVKVEVVPFESSLCDWRLHGLKLYSGFARYKNTVKISKPSGRYILKLGKTSFHAEVWVNGVFAGSRIWEPYELDITDMVRNGENEIVVIASNSAAVERQFMLVDEGEALGWNRYWNYDNIQREGENLVSGLQGPVRIHRIFD